MGFILIGIAAIIGLSAYEDGRDGDVKLLIIAGVVGFAGVILEIVDKLTEHRQEMEAIKKSADKGSRGI